MKLTPCLRLPALLALALLTSASQSWALFDAGSNSFAGASVIPNDYSQTVSTPTNIQAFTEEPGEEPHDPNTSEHAGNTAWWTWTAPDSGYCTVDTLRTITDAEGLNITIMSVYTGDTLNSLERVVGGGSYSSSDATPLNGLSQLTFFAIKGTQYHIAVDCTADGFITAATRRVVLQLRLLALKKTARITVFAVGTDGLGLITMDMTATGSLSGKIALGAKTYPFKGVFAADGYYTAVIPQKEPGALPLSLQIDGTGKGYIVLSMGGQNVAFSPFPRKLVFGALVENTTTNSYTTHLNRTGGDNPNGEGFFTLKISATGAVTGSGNTADGTAITFSTSLAEGTAANIFYVVAYKSLHKGKGGFALAGQLQENGAIDRFIPGGGIYIRPSSPAATFYPAGITMNFSMEGSTYTKPATGQRALGFLTPTLGVGSMDITDANAELGGNISEQLNLSDKNKFTFDSAARKPALNVNTTTGLVTGSITAPPLKKRTIKGVLVSLLGVPTIRGYVTGSSTNLFYEVTP